MCCVIVTGSCSLKCNYYATTITGVHHVHNCPKELTFKWPRPAPGFTMNPQETSIYHAILITAITLSIIIAYFLVSIIRQQRRNLALQRENIMAEVNAMERERTRIANDLHDDVSPILSVIRFQINSIAVKNDEDEAQIEQASEHLDNLIQRLREISNNLMPVSLQRKGLVVSIAEYLKHVENSARIKVHFQSGNSIEVPQEKSINIYRIIQEVVHNCIKHAKATEMALQIEAGNRNLSILYKDNGIGFNFDAAEKNSTGFGLKSLKSRVHILDGTMHTESSPGNGSQILFQFPLS
jgi:signal transduction histidine kinase